MKPQTKAYKHEIDLYFQQVPHAIRTCSVHGNTLIYIEYEDYLNEPHVMEALRKTLGCNVLLSVKRNCSDSLFGEIRQRYGTRLSQLELCTLLSEYES